MLLTSSPKSFGFGRPPSMCGSFIDCPLPKDTEETLNADGQKEGGCAYPVPSNCNAH